MIDCVKETFCTKCLHLPVCKHKDEYLKILKAIQDATVHTENSDGSHCMKKVTSYDFIGEIIVPCIHYSRITTIR